METSGIEIYPATHAPPQTVEDESFPSQLASWQASELTLSDGNTHFGFVHSGEAHIECTSGRFRATSGMYFSLPGRAKIIGNGCGFIATRIGWTGFFHLGGPAETQGRLKYIDGCSDSLLISPVVVGDPCLNLLYLPPHTQQTQHTHPSCRVGMIISGRGECRTEFDSIDLQPGQVFNIAPDALHSFHTQDQPLRVIAWHPDSDFGPEHHNHPMINRTMIHGVSASRLAIASAVEGD